MRKDLITSWATLNPWRNCVRRLYIQLVLVISVISSGCASTGYFKEASKTEAHATLRFEMRQGVAGKLFSAQNVLPMEINGLPPNDLTKWDFRAFRVQPGEVRLLVQISITGKIVTNCLLTFVAQANQVYYFFAENEDAVLRAVGVDENDAKVATCEGNKQLAPPPNTVPVFIPT